MNANVFLSLGVRVDRIKNFPQFFVRAGNCLQNARTKEAIQRLYNAVLIASHYSNSLFTDQLLDKTLPIFLQSPS